MCADLSPQALLGQAIRQQRELAALPMRQFAAMVGISNPYLSQIERGLRAPSDAVLEAIARSLDLSADELYSDAGFVDSDDDPEAGDLLAAIESADELTAAQRKTMLEIYRSFVDANRVRRVRKPKAQS